MHRSRTFLLLALIAVVALAACGSDSKDSSSSTTPSTKAAATTKAIVVGVDNAKLGRIVVNDKGATVYTLTDSAGNPLPCEGSCLAAWPPVLIETGAKASGGPGVSGVAVVSGPEGEQVTIKGLPVYTFAGDAGPGDANGEGIASFGGTWHAVKLSGGAAGTGTTDTTDTTSSYNYNN